MKDLSLVSIFPARNSWADHRMLSGAKPGSVNLDEGNLPGVRLIGIAEVVVSNLDQFLFQTKSEFLHFSRVFGQISEVGEL